MRVFDLVSGPLLWNLLYMFALRFVEFVCVCVCVCVGASLKVCLNSCSCTQLKLVKATDEGNRSFLLNMDGIGLTPKHIPSDALAPGCQSAFHTYTSNFYSKYVANSLCTLCSFQSFNSCILHIVTCNFLECMVLECPELNNTLLAPLHIIL